jgi:hypothetical protein
MRRRFDNQLMLDLAPRQKVPLAGSGAGRTATGAGRFASGSSQQAKQRDTGRTGGM